MKKVLLTLVAVVAFGGIANASAMTKEELIDKLSKDVTINGKTYTLSEGQKAQIDTYINAYEDLSEEDADVIAEQYEKAIDVVKESGATSFEALSKSDSYSKITEILETVSEETPVKATLSEGGVLTLKTAAGDVVASINANDKVIKTTGYPIAILAIASIVSVLGISVISKKISKANA